MLTRTILAAAVGLGICASVASAQTASPPASSGTLTVGEKQQLNRELNRNSRQIYRERHNTRTPKA